MKPENSIHELIRKAGQSLIMIKMKQEDQKLGLRILKATISNPNTVLRMVTMAVGKMVSIQTGANVQMAKKLRRTKHLVE